MPCTTLLVGRKASNDGSTMIARTDDGHFDVKKMVVVSPKQQLKKYKCVLSHLQIELPENKRGYEFVQVYRILDISYLSHVVNGC